MIKLYAFRWVPPFAQGLVRDLRVRWALEEAGLPYDVQLIGREDQESEAYRRLQPFGQVPAIEEDGLTLFESTSIVMHIGERSEVLLPSDAKARARTTTWMISAINSIEPSIQNLVAIDLFYAEEDWAKTRRPGALDFVMTRLRSLSAWLGDREYLEDGFTAGDLMMTTVLRNLRHTSILAEMPVLDAYRARCEARPAFGRALEAQMSVFAKHAPSPSAAE